MQISSTDNSSVIRELSSVLRTNRSTSTSTTSSATGTTDTEDSASISDPGELFAKLQQLQESDPDKFKELMTSIADQLTSAAADQDDEQASSMLTDLASKFSSAAETGDLSSLQPPKPPSLSETDPMKIYGQTSSSETEQPPPPPPPDDQQDSSSTSSTSSTDARDKLLQTLDSIFANLTSALSS